jgi:L-lactate dehydrogenase complex protein LldG
MREQILAKIRKALAQPAEKSLRKPDFSASVYHAVEENDLAVLFAQNLVKSGAKFSFCIDEKEFIRELSPVLEKYFAGEICVEDPHLQEVLKIADLPFSSGRHALMDAKVGITTCEALVARTGSVLVSSRQAGGRALSVFPEVHIVVAFTSQLVYDIHDAFALMHKRYNQQLPSMFSLITGPSRTADIEKTLVLGAHGPMALYVFLIESPV